MEVGDSSIAADMRPEPGSFPLPDLTNMRGERSPDADSESCDIPEA